MEKQSWLPQAQALSRGKKARVSHDCRDDRSMIISAGDKGWAAHCFRCGSAFEPYPTPTLAEQQAARAAQRGADEAARQSPTSPLPANLEPHTWPLKARVWLYKCGFTNPEIKEQGWYYHERTKRVVLPVVRDGRLLFWQARLIEGDGPKYLAPSVDRNNVAYRRGDGEFVVLTEDILSAAKVGRQAEAWSILGTKLTPGLLAELATRACPVVVWLDPDSAGRRGAAQIVRTLRSIGVPVSQAAGSADPKFLTNDTITAALGAALKEMQ